MENPVMTISFVTLIVGTYIYLKIPRAVRAKVYPVKIIPCTYESATQALDRIEKWTLWMAGLQTAGMGAMALLIKEQKCALNFSEEFNGFYTLLFFGLSIVISAWVLGGLPSIQQRLVKSNIPLECNDIYEADIFGHVNIPLGRLSGVIHTYFLFGLLFFSMFVISTF